MNETTTYWIQEQTKAGNWFDSVGLGRRIPSEALQQLKNWQRTFTDRKFRLVKRVDAVVAA